MSVSPSACRLIPFLALTFPTLCPRLSQRLERLLGVSGPNAKKKRAKLEREIEVEDGMGDEFGAFLSDLDRIGDVRSSPRAHTIGIFRASFSRSKRPCRGENI